MKSPHLVLCSLLAAFGVTFGIHKANAGNAVCLENGIESIRFVKLPILEPTVKLNFDYCSVNDDELPSKVIDRIRDLGRVHQKVADALGLSRSEVEAPGLEVIIEGAESAPIVSEASGDGKHITHAVFPDWNLGALPLMVYAHELVHRLSFSPGNPIAQAYLGFQRHPMMIEGFPDAVAMNALRDSSFRFEGANPEIPDCLLDIRGDKQGLTTLDDAFREFAPFSPRAKLQACCAGLSDRDHETPFVEVFCAAGDPGYGTAFET